LALTAHEGSHRHRRHYQVAVPNLEPRN
jgi:hypothetical protein